MPDDELQDPRKRAHPVGENDRAREEGHMAQKLQTSFRARKGNPFRREQPEGGSVHEHRHTAVRRHRPGHVTSRPRLRGTSRMDTLLSLHFQVCTICLTVYSTDKNAARALEKALPR